MVDDAVDPDASPLLHDDKGPSCHEKYGQERERSSKVEPKELDSMQPNPEVTAGWFSRITFMYMIPLLRLGLKRSLEEPDLVRPIPQLESVASKDRLKSVWEEEQRKARGEKRNPSLLKGIYRGYWKEVMSFGFLLFVEESVHLMQPVFMGLLIRYFRYDTPLTPTEALIAAIGVGWTATMFPFIHHPYFYSMQKIGVHIKVGASGLIVEKGIRLSCKALYKTTVGHMVNLLSNDVSKLEVAFQFFHYSYVGPVMLFGYGYFLHREIGWSFLIGFLVMFLMMPIQGFLGHKMAQCKREIAMRADKRVTVMTEILNGIRVIKMYAWEVAFANVVAQLRHLEMKMVRKTGIMQACMMALFWTSTKMILTAAFLCFFYTGNELTVEKIFIASALFNGCRMQITLFMPFAFMFFREAVVALTRIQSFLELEEYGAQSIQSSKHETMDGHDKLADEQQLLSNGASVDVPMTAVNRNNKKYEAKVEVVTDCKAVDAVVELEKFSSCWAAAEDEGADIIAVRDISFVARPGALVAVVGPVGAGKSSLLYSILRETSPVSGSLTVKGRVAFCSQDIWIFNGSVRDNVIFGEPFDEVRYEKALELSALASDVSQFPAGDQTVVGDRGTSLSGGQKARVSLARAVYSNADIYLLDDPLSAVDATVARFLFDKCICEQLIGQKKVVILVTHQVQYLDKTDTLILLRNGEVICSGSPRELRTEHAGEFTALMQETEKTYSARRVSESNSPRRTLSSESDDEEKSLLATQRSVKDAEVPEAKTEHVAAIEQEDRSAGSVDWRIYGVYLRSLSSNIIVVVVMLCVFAAVQFLFNVYDWWLKSWASEAERVQQYQVQNLTYTTNSMNVFGYDIELTTNFYVYGVICLNFLLLIMSLVRSVGFRLLQVTASYRLHERMFNAVVHTKIAFFDKNPIGRILNRFSKDIHLLDDALAFTFFEFLLGSVNILGSIVVIVVLNPIVLIPAFPLVLLFHLLRTVYLNTAREIKRLESTTRSPLFSHVSAVMNGLVTVRAFGRQDQVMRQFYKVQNYNISASGLMMTSARWFAFWIDMLVAAFVCVVAIGCVLSPAVLSNSDVALMLVYAVQLTGFFSWIMRQSAELQNAMVSVERIVQYTELESEHVKEKIQIADTRPTTGAIQFDKVSMRYSDDGELVLHNICLNINSGEKIGIVGRTGAGKSSLLRVLFRLTSPCDGIVYIDGVNTAHVELKTLRRRIAIIPQEPVLFIGTLRRNLDPFCEFTDDALWDALEQVELKEVVKELSGGLEASMQEGGVNFSVGQRQLVCLARALLRHSNILVIDEATANVDHQTDSLIQRTIRLRFATSTVLTIAHRLHTIMDSNRVLVLKDGEIAECGPPHELLANSSGLLTSLAAEGGADSANMLKKMAKEAYTIREQ